MKILILLPVSLLILDTLTPLPGLMYYISTIPMWQYTYLIINAVIISIPLLLTWHPKLDFYKDIRFLLISTLVVSTPFIIWDSIFTKIGVWSFNPLYTTGAQVFDLPVEEILFFVTVPYACMFTYRSIQYFVPNKKYPIQTSIGLSIAIISLILALIAFPLLYTTTMALLVGVMLLLLNLFYPQFLFQKQFIMYSLITLFLFIIFNFVLTSLPVVIYNPTYFTDLRIITIPIEDFLYNFVLLTSYLFIFTQSKKRYNSFKKKI